MGASPAMTMAARTAAAGPTYIVNQGFEGTGYDNGETWTENGSPNEDYSASPLVGSQSLQLSTAGQGTYTQFSAAAEYHAYFVLRMDTVMAGGDIASFGFLTAALDEFPAALRVLAAGAGTAQVKLRTNGSDSSASATTILDTEVWHVWIDWYNAGTCLLAMSTTGTKPSGAGAGVVYITKTGGSTNAGALYFSNGATTGGTFTVDRALVSTALIGDNP